MLFLLPSFAHALLPSLRALRHTRSAERAAARLCMDPVRVELSFEGGLSEVVSLTSEESIVEAAEELSEKHGLDPETSLEVEMELWNRWYQAADEAAPVYKGTSPEDGVVSELAASLELQEAGLVLEVGRSVVAPDGRGLFVRCTDEEREVSLSIGTAVCGYATGSMQVEPDLGGKAVGFALDSLDASCWFEKQLLSVRDVLELPDVDAIVGHEVIRAASGELEAIELDAEYAGARYFIPDAAQPDEVSILNAGQFANDLAVRLPPDGDAPPAAATAAAAEAATDDYADASAEANLLVLVYRLERDADAPSILVPSRPITTLARSITFANTVPMELGCRYGARYWE